MPRNIVGLVIALAIGAACPHVSFAYGLRTGFGKVVLENVPMAKEYSMRGDSNFPLVIKNESDRRVELLLEVLAPRDSEVQEGYKAIPDASWVTLDKNSFIVGPRGEAETDVTIYIPYNDEYIGEKFHVFIWSHTVGESLGVGIKSKLLFTVADTKE